ncbi:MAG: restriction endonuclease subunit S [Archangium sp.]|nr:restriction endonuclease subunit S [Archangium sp.]
MSNSTKARVGDLVEIFGGGTPKRSEPAYYGGDIPWVTPKDMKSWQISRAQISLTNRGVDESAARIVPSGSTLVVVRSGILKHTLPVGITSVPVAINQDMKALVSNGPRLYPEYLARLIKASSSIILGHVRATTADNFPTAVLRDLEIPLPSLGEQRRIAEILGRAEGLRAKRRAALALLDSLTQSIFLELFGDPALNPNNWTTDTLSSLVLDGDSINYGVVQPGDAIEDGVPLVRVGDLVKGRVRQHEIKRISPLIETKYARSRLVGDEILLSCVGSVGLVALADASLRGANIARAIARIRLKPTVSRVYVYELLRSAFLQRYFVAELRTVAQPTLNIKHICATPVIVPPAPLQAKFEVLASSVNELRYREERAVSVAEELFASLQHRAFSGTL